MTEELDDIEIQKIEMQLAKKKLELEEQRKRQARQDKQTSKQNDRSNYNSSEPININFKSKNTLVCHIMSGNTKEVGTAKTKLYAQEFQWRKRMWAIDADAIPWVDKKGISHLFVDVNESDGIIRFLEPRKLNLSAPFNTTCPKCNEPLEFPAIEAPIDLCGKCGDRITYDARNVRDLLKRKTIDTFWGLDSSHMILLIIMAIVAVGAMGGLFYLLGQNQKLQENLNKYLPSPVVKTDSNGKQIITKMILPEWVIVN